MKKIFFSLCMMVYSLTGYVQVYSDVYRVDSIPPYDLAQYIRGAGIDTIFNARIGPCNEPGYGIFKFRSEPCLGIDSGIVLSTLPLDTFGDPAWLSVNADCTIFPYNGRGFEVDMDYFYTFSPNNNNIYTLGEYDTVWANTPDDDIHALYNALPSPNLHFPNFSLPFLSYQYRCGLEFDFVPTGDSISLEFVWANLNTAWGACSQWNNIMGIFLSGPGIEGNKNIAVVPGTTIPISNNTINDAPNEWMTTGLEPDTGTYRMSFCRNIGEDVPYHEYYVNNYKMSNCGTYFSGYTTVMKASHAVSPCDTYHIRIVTSSPTHHAFESGHVSSQRSAVFVKAGSFSSNGPDSCGSTAVLPIEVENNLVQVYPNPFENGITLKLSGSSQRGEVFRVVMYSHTGTEVCTIEGDIDRINKELHSIGTQLSSGFYLLKVENKKGQYQLLKVVKK